jgi:acetyl-CoA C-acetyltransferase
MGVTAENLAEKWGISREEQDELAAESHRRAAAAIGRGPLQGPDRPDREEDPQGRGHRRHGRARQARPPPSRTLAKLRTAFKKDGGTVTAGNASGINDAAAFLVLADAEVAREANAKPLARLVSYAVAGVPNHIMGEGPIPATKLAMEKAGMGLDSIDVIESNEAFAAQAIAVARGLELDMKKTNPNGGAIALGHPVGASGAVLTVKAIYELHRTGGRYALVTMCIGGGQGIAAVFERL